MFENLDYCTEEELLEFANALRAAGAADALEALMPSDRQKPNSCLIANALNFKSYVMGHEDVGDGWVIYIHKDKVTPEMLELLGRELPADWDFELHINAAKEETNNYRCFELPERVGNTALAFDNGLGWTEGYAI